VRNGKKTYNVQNYLCKDCRHQFIAASGKYNGTIAWVVSAISRALVRGCGIRDIAVILEVSIGKILKTLLETNYEIKAKKKHYVRLEVDELWTFVKSKACKKRLIYAYDRDSGEIAAYVWGGRSAKTAKRLREKLEKSGVTYSRIAIDDWESFIKTFNSGAHDVGKAHTVGIEGNNALDTECGVFFVNLATSQKSSKTTSKPLI
jgi:IS1 family transposase